MPSPPWAQPLVPYRPRPASEILDLLLEALDTSLEEHCARRYEVPISLSQVTQSNTDPSSMHFQLERRGLTHMTATIGVKSVGGNTYDVRCAVADGPSCQYSYSLPGDTAAQPMQAPLLATTLVRFLLDALEQRIGRECLRGSATSPPGRLTKSAREDPSGNDSSS